MAPRDHPLVGKKNISLSELVEHPFIMREPGSGIRDATLRLFAAAGLQPRVRMELGSNEAIKHAIVGGLGLAVLSLHTLALEGPDGPVAILDVENFPIHRQWYIVFPKGKELSLVARTFLDFVIASEARIREDIVATWPLLMQQPQTRTRKKAAPRKRKTAK
jgi:DNA-binding transcriptional LysR family regulator